MGSERSPVNLDHKPMKHQDTPAGPTAEEAGRRAQGTHCVTEPGAGMPPPWHSACWPSSGLRPCGPGSDTSAAPARLLRGTFSSQKTGSF